jgi:hypothetical protein
VRQSIGATRAQVVRVRPLEPMIYAGVAVTFSVVAALACLPPSLLAKILLISLRVLSDLPGFFRIVTYLPVSGVIAEPIARLNAGTSRSIRFL